MWFRRQGSRRGFILAVTVCTLGALLLWSARHAQASRRPSVLVRAFNSPIALFNGVTGDLVVPTGSATTLSFETGKVALGALPAPFPEQVGRRGRAAQHFLRPGMVTPHARLLLTGVADRAGTVTNTGDRLIIDAVISPSSAARTAPPFVFPFEIHGGTAVLDVALPVQSLSDGPVRIQVLGVTVLDPEGQPFGALGFELSPVPPTPPPTFTPTPSGSPLAVTPAADGQCFRGPNCTGRAYPSSRERCCGLIVRGQMPPAIGNSWCPADQIDPTDGHCVANACGACLPPQTPSPCVVGQCFDTITFSCTGQACGANGRCPLPNQLCDLTGRRCPCPPLPGQCSSDKDCDDRNACTVDHCTASGCVHDCVCVGPMGECGPGPGRH